MDARASAHNRRYAQPRDKKHEHRNFPFGWITMAAQSYNPMKTQNSSSPVTKTLQSLRKSRAAGIVAAVVGAAAASAVGAVLVKKAKKARASTGKKKPASKKATVSRAANSARRPSRIKGKGRTRSTAKASA
jgi:hypothetical protein